MNIDGCPTESAAFALTGVFGDDKRLARRLSHPIALIDDGRRDDDQDDNKDRNDGGPSFLGSGTFRGRS